MTSGGSRPVPDPLALVGREEELAYLDDVRRARPSTGAVVAGPQGVGKTRLVVEAVARARVDRWSVERIDGAAAADAVPLSAVAHLAPPDAVRAGDPLRLMLEVSTQVTRRAARQPLVLLVDDAHLLDEASLAWLRQVAPDPNLFLLLTVRSDEPVPAPVVGLWKDGHAQRLELQPLSQDETYRLAAHAVGREEPDALRRLWSRSLGNPLFLRELVLMEREGSTPGGERRTRVAAEPPTGAHRLAEVVQSRLGELDHDHRRVLELVTVAGPLGLNVLTGMASPRTVDDLVGRGLLAVREDEPEPVVALDHPVFGVVVQQTMAAARSRRLRIELLDCLEKLEAEHQLAPRDVVRLVTLRLDLGSAVAAPDLLAAARYVQAAYPRAVADRLAVGTPEVDGVTAAVAAPDRSAPPSEDDLVVAERLARQAWEADGTLASGLTLVTILVARRDVAEAGDLVGTLADRADGEDEQTQVALAEAGLELWVRQRADQAERVLRAAEARVSGQPQRDQLRRLRAGIALNAGRVTQAVALSEELLDGTTGLDPADVPVEAAQAAATAAAGRALCGQPEVAMELAGRFIAVVQPHLEERPEVLGELLLARLFAARLLGRLEEAEWLGYACYQPAVESGSSIGMAIFTGALGQIALDRGLPATAGRRLREAEILLREYDTFGYRPWVLADLAVALAQQGEAEAARSAYEAAEAAVEQPRYFDAGLVLARAWVAAVHGRREEASAVALDAAALARSAGLASFEMAALHATVRFGDAAPVAARLTELAGVIGGPLADACARHARARADRDAEELAAVSGAFERLAADLLAAEAAAQAATEHSRAGRRRDAARVTARVEVLIARTEGRRCPTLRLAARPPTLTGREHEVALLAADGLTSRQIAERLVVSPRTVESHLYRVFTKLGVDDRAELAGVLHA